MDLTLMRHYLSTGPYTYPGLYRDYFKTLPDDVSELGELICSQIIHRVTLKQGNTNANEGLIYGDMDLFPWYRMRCEDDVFLTAPAMTAELFRLDDRGFTRDRRVECKLVVTCRYVSVLMSSILKAKGIPCRSRSGFAPYIDINAVSSYDHWINQYWDDKRSDWVSFDSDGFFKRDVIGFDQYDIPFTKFDWAADTWLKIRRNKTDGNRFVYAGGETGIEAAIRAVFYDYHSLMNNEISYLFQPAYIDWKVDWLNESDLAEIDHLAGLMLAPDKNFNALCDLWKNNRKFRILNSPLVGDLDNGL